MYRINDPVFNCTCQLSYTLNISFTELPSHVNINTLENSQSEEYELFLLFLTYTVFNVLA